MQSYRFGGVYARQEEFPYRQSKSNRLRHPLQNYSSESNSCESDLYNFINNVEWVYTDPIVHKDYLPYENENNSLMHLVDSPKTDCSAEPEVNLVDAMLNSGNYIVDYDLIQNFPTLQCEFASVSYVDQLTTEGCYKSGYHVGNAGLDCFENIEDRCDLFYKDSQEILDERCNRTIPQFFASSGQVPETLQNKLVFSGSKNDQVFERPKHSLPDESSKEWGGYTSQNGVDGFPESQCNYKKLPTETQPGLECFNKRIKDDRYWKRRKKNNEAAKRSRTAKQSRFAFMEKRIKELEAENAEKKEHLRILEQKISENEGKSVSP